MPDRDDRQGATGHQPTGLLTELLRVAAGILMWPLLVFVPVAVVLLIGGIGNLVQADEVTTGLWLGPVGLFTGLLGVWCYRVTTDGMRKPLQLLMVFLQS